MTDTPQPKSDVQTLLEYFDKLIGTFRSLIWIASIAVVIISTIFTILLFKNKDDATAKVLEAEKKAETAFVKADSLIRNAQNSIDETEADAKQGIASVSEVAEREISNLKSIARQRANEEVNRFVKSEEIQNLIDTKVRKEIEGSYFREVNELSQITTASNRMIVAEDFDGMLELQKYVQESKNPLSRKFASDLLEKNCLMVMTHYDNNYPNYLNLDEDMKTWISKTAPGEEYSKENILDGLKNDINSSNPRILKIAEWVHAVNIIYKKKYTVCEIEEVLMFLKSKK